MKQSGLTIIEVLVALVLLGLLAASITTLFPTLVNVNRSSSLDQQVTVAAQDFLEQVRSSWQIQANFDAQTLPANPQGDIFTCTSIVTDPDNLDTPIRQRVTVACTGQQAGTATYTFTIEYGRPE